MATSDGRRGWIAAFACRRFYCSSCGRNAPQTRTSDPRPESPRYALVRGELLLPHCDRCMSGRRTSTGPVGDHPAVDPVPLTAYRCSVGACVLVWHELGVRPPVVPVYDEAEGLPRHPCPWCLHERPDVARRDHLALARGRVSSHRPPDVGRDDRER